MNKSQWYEHIRRCHEVDDAAREGRPTFFLGDEEIWAARFMKEGRERRAQNRAKQLARAQKKRERWERHPLYLKYVKWA